MIDVLPQPQGFKNGISAVNLTISVTSIGWLIILRQCKETVLIW